MNQQAFELARLTRDPRFDGLFFVGVITTGIYCRPICRARLPKSENVTFLLSAAAARAAGFRPCLRCRPEAAPATPAGSSASAMVARGLQLITAGVLGQSGVKRLSDRLGVTARHLRRLFRQHLGVTPHAIAQTRRLEAAAFLLDQTQLSMDQIAQMAGYGSVRRFNAHFQQIYQRLPSSLRSRSKKASHETFSLRLAYRPPFDFDGLLKFLALRGIPGVEWVNQCSYGRSILIDGQPGSFRVCNDPDKSVLICRIMLQNPAGLLRVVARIRALFDLDADPLAVGHCLALDPLLAPLVAENPGQRVPGGWDPFEIAVRAIVGQQISVKGATTVMGRIAGQYGRLIDKVRFFPSAAELANLDPKDLPMPLARAAAIAELSRRVASGELEFDRFVDSQSLINALVSIKGIGGWTARYVAMRAINDSNAFLHDDLVLARVAQQRLGLIDSQALLAQAQNWQPWRAYAGMHLWRQAAKPN